jgi:glyoxylase-like metal-dependent hydrolase (beta-lactamase superfamily II)
MKLKHEWFNIYEIEHDIFRIEEPGHVQCYLIKGKTRAALIDTGMGFCNIEEAIQPLTDTPVWVFNTHWHFDHIGGNALFQNIGIAKAEQHLLTQPIPNATLMPLYIRPCLEQGTPLPKQFCPEQYAICSPPATFTIDDGDTFDLGGRTLTAILTPGHTHGSCSFLESGTKSLFCGDVLYRGTLYAHFIDSDIEEYIHSLQKLLAQQDSFSCIYSAHDVISLPTSFLVPVLEAFQEITTDIGSESAITKRRAPVASYQYDDFDIVIKSRDFKGVNLLEWV